MLRYLSIAIVLFSASMSCAQDICPIVFEDETVMSDGERIQCQLYYILLGDSGKLSQGDLIQIQSRVDQPGKYSYLNAKFKLSENDELTVFWPAQQGQRYGSVEKGKLTQRANSKSRFRYHISSHGDESQVGENQNVRIVDFKQLPAWVQKAVHPFLVAKLSPRERRAYDQLQLIINRMQAESLRTAVEISETWLNVGN